MRGEGCSTFEIRGLVKEMTSRAALYKAFVDSRAAMLSVTWGTCLLGVVFVGPGVLHSNNTTVHALCSIARITLARTARVYDFLYRIVAVDVVHRRGQCRLCCRPPCLYAAHGRTDLSRVTHEIEIAQVVH